MTVASDSAPTTELTPLPDEVSESRVKSALIRLGGVLIIAVIAVTLLPGLGQLRHSFEHAQADWILAGVALEVLSMMSYVGAFRVVFCTRMKWGTSYKIAMAEQGANSLLPVGGAGGLALGAWALKRGGMPAEEIARKTVAFFLLTSVPNVGTLVLVSIGLAVGVLPGNVSLTLALVPAAVAVLAVLAVLQFGRLSQRVEARLAKQPGRSRLTRIAPALRATADGVDDALGLLRHGDPLLLLGLFGYMLFDILVLWASFRALGARPELTIVWIAYLIGQLGNLVPIPGGIGGVEGGLIGSLVVYGLPALTSTAAVLLYRVIELWLPAAFGAVAFVQLRSLLRREAETIDLCQPGEVVEIIGQGAVVAKPVA